MDQTTLSSTQSPEHRRATRVRKVRPVAFVAQAMDAEPALQTVTANVSLSGMLLVTRRDQFPPAGAGILLMPFETRAGTPDSSAAIRGRIVYTRYSPKARLRFAGLKFEQDLPERTVQMLGLDGAPDAVADAITTLDELESVTLRAPQAIEVPALVRELPIVARMSPSPAATTAVQDARVELDSARREFFRVAAAFLSGWGEARIRQTIGERHALARAKGIEGLRGLKAEWERGRQSFPVLVEVEIGRSMEAGSNDGAGSNPYYNLRLDQPPSKLMQALRDLAGSVGRMLIEHGFEDGGAVSDWAPIAQERGRVSFRGPMSISEAMREGLIRMATLHGDVQRATQETQAIREESARAEALQMWDRA